jgi:hypothetical protein
MSRRILISDTNLWIDLHRAGLTTLVYGLQFQFVATDFVINELNLPDGKELQAMGLEAVPLEGPEILELFELRQTLGNSSLADVSCFYLAKAKGWTLVTGDGSVRAAACDADLEVHGVLWVPDQVHDAGLATGAALAVALEKMLKNKARLPKDECQ